MRTKNCVTLKEEEYKRLTALFDDKSDEQLIDYMRAVRPQPFGASWSRLLLALEKANARSSQLGREAQLAFEDHLRSLDGEDEQLAAVLELADKWPPDLDSATQSRSSVQKDSRAEQRGRGKATSEVELVSTVLGVGVVNFFGSLLVVTGIMFAVNLNSNPEPKYTDLYILLLWSYFIAGVASSWRCGQYTKAMRGTVLNPTAIFLTFVTVLVLTYSMIPVASLVADMGERYVQLQVSVPENVQGLEALSVNALLAFAIGWGVSAAT